MKWQAHGDCLIIPRPSAVVPGLTELASNILWDPLPKGRNAVPNVNVQLIYLHRKGRFGRRVTAK